MPPKSLHKIKLEDVIATRISLPIGTNGKPLAAIGKFVIGKTLATNGGKLPML